MDKKINNNTLGIIGLAKAIEWFSKNDYIISLPINDCQSYDLVVEKDHKFKTVQVKYTGNVSDKRKQAQYFRVAMHRYKYTTASFEYLFIYTSNDTCYLFRSNEINNFRSITLYPKYDKHIVK